MATTRRQWRSAAKATQGSLASNLQYLLACTAACQRPDLPLKQSFLCMPLHSCLPHLSHVGQYIYITITCNV